LSSIRPEKGVNVTDGEQAALVRHSRYLTIIIFNLLKRHRQNGSFTRSLSFAKAHRDTKNTKK
jgi:hypothetical protein